MTSIVIFDTIGKISIKGLNSLINNNFKGEINKMAIYIALLRGINVGGKNKIKMFDLKHMFESMGINQVQTYIQSGNVIFQSEEDEDFLRVRIEHEIKSIFGFEVNVVLRTSAELEYISLNCPFSEKEVSEAKSSSELEILYVSLLIQSPAQDGIQRLNAYRTESDEYQIQGREVFLLLRHGIRNSKLANNLQKLGVTGTMRNWKTITKLHALAKDMERRNEK